MKRLTCTLVALLLAGCGGGNVAVELVPEGAGYVMATGTNGSALANAATTRSVKLMIAEVSAHVASGKGEGGWHVVSSSRREVDLQAITVDKGELFGDAQLPPGKITQLRIKLARNGGDDGEDGRVVLEQAVVERDGTNCDLSVPSSAFDPGLKLTGAFKAIDVDPEKRSTFVVAVDLKDASRDDSGDGCVWRLNPVIKLHDVKGE